MDTTNNSTIGRVCRQESYRIERRRKQRTHHKRQQTNSILLVCGSVRVQKETITNNNRNKQEQTRTEKTTTFSKNNPWWYFEFVSGDGCKRTSYYVDHFGRIPVRNLCWMRQHTRTLIPNHNGHNRQFHNRKSVQARVIQNWKKKEKRKDKLQRQQTGSILWVCVRITNKKQQTSEKSNNFFKGQSMVIFWGGGGLQTYFEACW